MAYYDQGERPMKISLNGKPVMIDEATTLAALIQDKCPNPKTVVAEVNETIIKRETWAATQLSENDRVELVTFVGGG